MENNFAKNLLFLRKARKMNQTELATALDLTRSTLSNYETGFTQPDIETILKIAKYFRIKVDVFLTADLEESELVPGDPAQIGEVIEDIEQLQQSLGKVGRKLRGIMDTQA